ncbi:hypothetical protein FACS1894178_9180 [Bacteroidia bacterium]|nr:hypothetical protein FACS1894178_9180 [Bacteroidia bacterium]
MEKNFYIETYGCQMNFADSEIVNSLLIENGYFPCDDYKKAVLILINTCSIRDHAEQRVLNRLQELNALKKKNPDLKVGIIGCMAERLKEELLEKQQVVDLVAGPDVYRSLPEMLRNVFEGEKSVNTLLSEEETYAEIEPVRLSGNRLSAFISIMRGCQNYCSYCVVPYTRGKERSRDWKTIVAEAKKLFENGYREVTLLGQNVNSYTFEGVNFAELLRETAKISPKLRVRFATSHPKDISDDVPESIKLRRLNEIIALQQDLSHESNKHDIEKKFEILVEGISKRSGKQYFGRTSNNKVVIFNHNNENIGDYIYVKITNCTAATLFGNKIEQDA